MRCTPNGLFTGALSSPGLSAFMAFSNSGTVWPGFIQPRVPPLAGEPPPAEIIEAQNVEPARAAQDLADGAGLQRAQGVHEQVRELSGLLPAEAAAFQGILPLRGGDRELSEVGAFAEIGGP